MKLNKNLVIIHAYLSADGYVIKNPKTQKNKYYMIGLRNNNLVLLRDFQNRFKKIFGKKPYIVKDGRCRIGSKEIYTKLINKFNSFYSSEWRMPKLSNKLKCSWLRTFFDCEGWVFCKTHQNRHIGLDSINEYGLDQIIASLNKIGIKTIKKINKKKKIFRILIYGKENLIKFQKNIGFLHPEKKKKLQTSIKDYMNYEWIFPKNIREEFLKNLLKDKIRIKKPFYLRIISKEEKNLIKVQRLLKRIYKIHSLVNKRVNGLGTIYYELNINKKEDIRKLINMKIIPNILENV